MEIFIKIERREMSENEKKKEKKGNERYSRKKGIY